MSYNPIQWILGAFTPETKWPAGEIPLTSI